MGLDITLGTLIFLSAVRGWFKGFLRQAITLGSLVGCVFLADPLRGLARPYAQEYLPSVAPDILDRIVWWAMAVGSYLVTSGIGLAILKASKRKTYGDPEPNRTDQGAGFTLGALKGFVVASFLVAGVARITPGQTKFGAFAEDQAKASRALAWSEQYRPAEKIWESPPVQTFVTRVRTRGMWGGKAEEKAAPAEKVEEDAAKPETARVRAADPPRTASTRPKVLTIPRLDPNSETFGRDLESEMRRQGLKPDWR